MSEDNIKKGFGKYVWIIGVVALFGSAGIFAYLESLGLQITCEDKVCDINNVCDIYCTVKNPTSQSVYLFNHDDWKITFSPEIDEFDLYAKYYRKWRYTNFTKATRFPNIPDDKLYVFVFPRYSTKEFKLVVTLNDTDTIKWNFNTLDPYIVGYKYLYEEIKTTVPVYCERTIDVAAQSYKNGTITKDYSYTESYKCDTKTIIEKGKRIGVEIDKKEILNSNVKGNYLIEWDVPIGDRNMDEFGDCTETEKMRGVCTETDLIKQINEMGELK